MLAKWVWHLTNSKVLWYDDSVYFWMTETIMTSFSNYRPVCENKSINNDQTRPVPVEYKMITFVPRNRRLKSGCNYRSLSTRISNTLQFICCKWGNLKRIFKVNCEGCLLSQFYWCWQMRLLYQDWLIRVTNKSQLFFEMKLKHEQNCYVIIKFLKMPAFT